jgi:hypothetical protein
LADKRECSTNLSVKDNYAMDKNRLKELAGSKRFIEGIYNYCDRWCERCPFTLRCLNYAMAEDEPEHAENQDVRNQAFWQKIGETLNVTLELLHEFAEEHGIDLGAIDSEEAAETAMLRDEMARDHGCCRAARAYGEMVNDWVESTRGLMEQREPGPGEGVIKGTEDAGAQEAQTALDEALEVIHWYQHQIYVKLMRAARGSLTDDLEAEEGFQKDSDGSAKVALIGIDRSLAAWGEVRRSLPLFEQETVRILLHLERLRREVEKAFPEARAFIRPGFDRVDLQS